MTNIANYYDLESTIQMSDNKLTWLNKDPKYYEDLITETKANKLFKKDFDELKTKLLLDDSEADNIQIGFISTTNGLLSEFLRISRWPRCYPDLNQGMIIKGYLFGLILTDYKTNLTTEGRYHPYSRFYMSANEWPAKDVENLLDKVKENLLGIRFKNQMDAIIFYEKRILQQFLQEIHILKELHIIM